MPRERFKTLTEQMFYILLCLRQECYGLDILDRIPAMTGNRVSVGSGTLYNLLEQFLEEDMIRETERAYGEKLKRLAQGILSDSRDAEESVEDTYMKAWQSIPPQRPERFFLWLSRVCRNMALSRLEWNNAAKRGAPVVELSRELESCIPDRSMEEELELRALGEMLDRFLGSLSKENRVLFLRRYWFADSVADIARRFGFTESKVKVRLYRTRNELRTFLAKEGISL